MYCKIIEMLKQKGVVFERGLNSGEIDMIETLYDISFPNDLKTFYMSALPVSNDFYNWRDISPENVCKIQWAFIKPVLSIAEGVDEVDWNDKWGEEPTCNIIRREKIIQMVKDAPKLIPIYGHRYVATQYDNNPVLSICDLDIIYYGSNIKDYLYNEFKLKAFENMGYAKIKPIDFWSDLL